MVPVTTPLRDASCHIIATIYAVSLLKTSYSNRQLAFFSDIAPFELPYIAPWESSSVCASCGLFPLCFCWQAFTGPCGVSVSIIPIYSADRIIGIIIIFVFIASERISREMAFVNGLRG